MSEITIGFKSLLGVITTTAGVVSAYWLARRAATKENRELEKELNKLHKQVIELSSKTQDREDVKELVKESLENLSSILTSIEKAANANSEDIKKILIAQGILNQKVQVLEDRRDANR